MTTNANLKFYPIDSEIERVISNAKNKKQVSEYLPENVSTLKYAIVFDNNFTTVLLKHNKKLWVGTSKRNPKDEYKMRDGVARAAHRAAISLPIQLPADSKKKSI